MHTDGDQVVLDPQEERSMVATSVEVYTCCCFLSQIVQIP